MSKRDNKRNDKLQKEKKFKKLKNTNFEYSEIADSYNYSLLC